MSDATILAELDQFLATDYVDQTKAYFDGPTPEHPPLNERPFGWHEAFAGLPTEASLCWDVKVGWVPVRAIDPATGRPHTEGPSGTTPAPTQE